MVGWKTAQTTSEWGEVRFPPDLKILLLQTPSCNEVRTTDNKQQALVPRVSRSIVIERVWKWLHLISEFILDIRLRPLTVVTGSSPWGKHMKDVQGHSPAGSHLFPVAAACMFVKNPPGKTEIALITHWKHRSSHSIHRKSKRRSIQKIWRHWYVWLPHF